MQLSLTVSPEALLRFSSHPLTDNVEDLLVIKCGNITAKAVYKRKERRFSFSFRADLYLAFLVQTDFYVTE